MFHSRIPRADAGCESPKPTHISIFALLRRRLWRVRTCARAHDRPHIQRGHSDRSCQTIGAQNYWFDSAARQKPERDYHARKDSSAR
ncbi:hypothetical protein EMPG_15742 [Blastomyces silverae]|uniref:Uncharacterized protein n=1 Tax=Blastomyces silverae TaxID=2060906 RepID=A0A0H1BI52_9EURO|nr:hypothetical protein EMPG_15742 [Blastomyces silverae]